MVFEKPAMKGNRLRSLVALLLALNVVLLWRFSVLKHRLAQMSTVSEFTDSLARYVLTQPFRTLDGRLIQLSEIPEPLLLVFIFRPTNCPPCLQELSLYSKRIGRASVYGIGLGTNEQEMRLFLQESPLQFPVLIDEEGWLSGRLPDAWTPFKLLLDRAVGRVLLRGGPNAHATDQQRFLDRVNQLVTTEP